MKFTKEDIFTIPNILSFLRILMIPGIVVLYCVYQEYAWATALIVLSGITDVVDGRIARTFNMVSDFGKMLDPVADKLTQAAVVVCLVIRYNATIHLPKYLAISLEIQLLKTLWNSILLLVNL